MESVLVLLCLACFPEHDVLGVRPRCGMGLLPDSLRLNNIPPCVWPTFCLSVPLSVNLPDGLSTSVVSLLSSVQSAGRAVVALLLSFLKSVVLPRALRRFLAAVALIEDVVCAVAVKGDMLQAGTVNSSGRVGASQIQ